MVIGSAIGQTPPASLTLPPFSGSPFSLSADIVPGSALDVSFLLHRPAGKHGTVKARGENLTFADGTAATFWGVNLCWDSLYPSDADGEAVARRLAMSGVNLVRLTYLDGGPHGLFRQDRPDTRTPDTERLQRLDSFTASLKRNGVYSLLVLGMGRSTLKPGDGLPPETDPAASEAAYAIGRFFDDRVMRADQDVWRTLLSRVNPKTGLRWADDPAVIGIEILNEGSLFYRYDRFARLPPALKARIQMRWNRWLASRYQSRDSLAAAWQETLRDTEDPWRGTVALDFSFLESGNPLAAAAVNSQSRGTDWNRFLADVCRDYYREQIAFLRGLGVRQPISCNGGGSFSAADRWSNLAGDLFDQHQYHDHPNWSPYLTYSNRSSLQTGLGIVNSLARGRIAGMPYGVTEYDFCYPNDWRAEGWVPLAAYARFQRWNFATAFAYNSQPWTNRAVLYGNDAEITGVWRFHNDPASFGQMPLSSLLFLRGDVKPARKTVDVTFSETDTFLPEPGRFPPDPLRFLGDLPLVHRTRQVYDGERAVEKGDRTASSGRGSGQKNPQPAILFPQTGEWRTTDTGELRYNQAAGVFVIDTPRTQGVVGFAGAKRYQTRDVALRMENPFGSVVLSSLDGQPIRTSRRMLLTAVGRCQNTGFLLTPAPGSAGLYQANKTSLGAAPIAIDPIRVTLTLPAGRTQAGLQAYALDGAGNRIAPIPVRRENGTVTVTMTGVPATIYYELVRP